jgi:tetratricopeptide (TPR) repeat protein
MRQGRATCGVIAIAFVLVQASSLPAQTAQDIALCDGKDHVSADQQIEACTAILHAKPRNAAAFNNRGSAYDGKQDYDRAIADFTAAVMLDPAYAVAFYNRARVYRR